jgi:hypothetical protein
LSKGIETTAKTSGASLGTKERPNILKRTIANLGGALTGGDVANLSPQSAG